MTRTVLVFGLIAGAILGAMMWATIPFMERIGFDNGMVIGYTSMVLAFLLVFFGIRSYRDNVSGGSISFGRAFQVGGLIMLVASLCYVASWQVMYYAGPAGDYFDRHAEHAVAEARAGGATDAEVAETRAKYERWAELYQNPLINAGITLLEPLPVGLIMTLVSAGILSRRRRPEGVVPV